MNIIKIKIAKKLPNQIVWESTTNSKQQQQQQKKIYTQLHINLIMAVDLIYHATSGNIPKLKLCLSQGVHVDAVNFNNECSLLFAAKHGHLQAVKLLLSHGANTNMYVLFGWNGNLF